MSSAPGTERGADLLAVAGDRTHLPDTVRIPAACRGRGHLTLPGGPEYDVSYGRSAGLFRIRPPHPIECVPLSAIVLSGMSLTFLSMVDGLDSALLTGLSRRMAYQPNEPERLLELIRRTRGQGPGMSPAERNVLTRISESEQPLHIGALKAGGAYPPAARLLEAGRAFELSTGHLVEPARLARYADSLQDGETADARSMAAHWGCSHSLARSLLDAMVDRGLVEYAGGGRFRRADGAVDTATADT